MIEVRGLPSFRDKTVKGWGTRTYCQFKDGPSASDRATRLFPKSGHILPPTPAHRDETAMNGSQLSHDSF
jgi:hypothetical protein